MRMCACVTEDPHGNGARNKNSQKSALHVPVKVDAVDVALYDSSSSSVYYIRKQYVNGGHYVSPGIDVALYDIIC